MSPRLLATLIGFVAVLLWSLLALLTAASNAMPPFQLLAVTFAIATAMGAASWIFRKGAWRALRQPWPVWVLGVGGLFGYHAVYFAALKAAPPAEASLIAYLWPLFIVLFSAFLPGERLRANHVAGALIGFSGIVVLAFGKGLELNPAYLGGYGLAFGCALIWSIYSVLSRRVAAVPTDAVVGFCAVTALLGAAAHGFLEISVWPTDVSVWIAILALGLGPVGLAFYTWDYGVKHGDIRLLGVSSYAAPILSTLILVVAGFAPPTLSLFIACLLIAGGATLASLKL